MTLGKHEHELFSENLPVFLKFFNTINKAHVKPDF